MKHNLNQPIIRYSYPIAAIRALNSAIEIRPGTRQLQSLSPKEICVSSKVRRQIIAEAKLS